MKYNINPKNGDNISALSFGSMRLPGDHKKAAEIVRAAVEQGVNYFDTAYMYMGNEEKLGFALTGLREQVKIATKIPPYLVSGYGDFDKIFKKQLARLNTDYIDYYLIHMLTESRGWARLVDLGVLKWLNEKKAEGAILNFGFSYHGGKAEFEKIIDAHDWDFCMIQYNYFDEHNQAGRSGLDYAFNKGVPVIAMEPLRGGGLVRLPARACAVIDNAYIKRSAAEWGLLWLFDQPELLTVLSGISSVDILNENIRILNSAEPLSDKDFDVYKQIIAALKENVFVPCTGCNYCMPCPCGVDIPLCFSCLNDINVLGAIRSRTHYVLHADKHHASLCNKCGKCERNCPQSIEIRAGLELVRKKMEGFYFKPLRFAVRKFMRTNK